jgi:hypothetical protein
MAIPLLLLLLVLVFAVLELFAEAAIGSCTPRNQNTLPEASSIWLARNGPRFKAGELGGTPGVNPRGAPCAAAIGPEEEAEEAEDRGVS